MELFIAGGVGEHGRNCFYVKGKTVCFLVDCGKMADMPEEPYPHLTADQIQRLNAVFLTHSHADHTGALPWLLEKGFAGPVIASEETLRQLPFPLPNKIVLETLCPERTGQFGALTIQWGRSGHCAGSVWYHFNEDEKSIFFSGDYTENTQVYTCDPIRDQSADLAVLDCAYGVDQMSYADACSRLLQRTETLLLESPLLLFPVPKYGRGLELMQLFARYLKGVPCYGDAQFTENLSAQRAGGFWYHIGEIHESVPAYEGQLHGIVFVSDPQLRGQNARNIAEQVLSLGGKAVMTGTLEKNSFSERLFQQGNAELLRYPVHLNRTQFERLAGRNHFLAVIPYHSKEYSVNQEIVF